MSLTITAVSSIHCQGVVTRVQVDKLVCTARRELLRGPLFYVLVMTAVTVVFWRESPVGMMVLSLMCGGDGLADIIGRRFGATKLPFNRSKSWAGSAAMFAGKLLLEAALYSYIVFLFCLHLPSIVLSARYHAVCKAADCTKWYTLLFGAFCNTYAP